MRYRMPSGSTLKERLDHFSAPTPCGCRLWTGAVDGAGYGMLWIGHRSRRAHIVAWEEAHGRAKPPGLYVCHTCDVPGCIELGHLFLGTPADNNRDREQKGRGRQPRGERNSRAKLTEAAVRAIRADFRPSAIVGKQFGINPSTVNRIRNHDAWGHIT